VVGPLYKLNPVDPQLETARFQPLNPEIGSPGFNFCFFKFTTCTATQWASQPPPRLLPRDEVEACLCHPAPEVLVAMSMAREAAGAAAKEKKVGLALFTTLFCSQSTSQDGACNQSDTRE
jgi:hypothetical protein